MLLHVSAERFSFVYGKVKLIARIQILCLLGKFRQSDAKARYKCERLLFGSLFKECCLTILNGK